MELANITYILIALCALVFMYKIFITKQPSVDTSIYDNKISDLQQQLNRQQQEINNDIFTKTENISPVIVSTLPYNGYGAYPYFYRGRGWNHGWRGGWRGGWHR